MFGRVQQLVDMLEGQKGSPLLLGRWIKHFAYDFMSDVVFGGGSEQMREGDGHNLWAAADKGAGMAYFLGQIPWLGVYLGRFPGAGGPLRTVVEYCRKEIAKRLARGSSSSRELLFYLNNEDLPNKAPPKTRHLLNDGIVAMGAASKTISGALISTFHCLLLNPEVYTALQDEVDRFYPQDEYLTAVIHEALRLLPPAATSTPRQVPHNAATVVLGSVVLPPGTFVSVPPYVLHRDARNFVFPDACWSERWLVASGQLPLARARPPRAFPGPPSGSQCASESGVRFQTNFVHSSAAFIPFSHGPMGCAGTRRGLAMLEMRAVMCALGQRFWIRISPGEAERLTSEDGHGEGNKACYLTANRLELPAVLEPRW